MFAWYSKYIFGIGHLRKWITKWFASILLSW